MSLIFLASSLISALTLTLEMPFFSMFCSTRALNLSSRASISSASFLASKPSTERCFFSSNLLPSSVAPAGLAAAVRLQSCLRRFLSYMLVFHLFLIRCNRAEFSAAIRRLPSSSSASSGDCDCLWFSLAGWPRLGWKLGPVSIMLLQSVVDKCLQLRYRSLPVWDSEGMDFGCQMAEEEGRVYGLEMDGKEKAFWWIKNRSDDGM